MNLILESECDSECEPCSGDMKVLHRCRKSWICLLKSCCQGFQKPNAIHALLKSIQRSNSSEILGFLAV